MIQKPAREDILNLPNLLSLLRVGSIPLLLVFMHLTGEFWAWVSTFIFFAAGLTDLADGFFARRLKKVTTIGTYLDPMADKLLVCSLLVMLVALDRASVWATIIIICREIAVTGMRAVAASQGFSVPSDFFGKFKTAVQMAAVLLMISPSSLWGFAPRPWGAGLLWAAACVALFSGAGYFWRFVHRLQAPPQM